MNSKNLYDATAEKYDDRHDNARTKYMRTVENKLIKRYASGKVLDIGCGTGQHMKYANVGVDISAEMLREAKKKGHDLLVQAKAEELPFADNFFDSILCIFTVLNLCNYNMAVQEIHRILKKNGIAIVSVASIWDHSKENLAKRLVYNKQSHALTMRIEKFRFRFFAFNKNDLIGLFEQNNFRLLHFKGIYMIAKPYWGWHRHHSLPEKIKLKTECFLEKILQPLNKSARMYFGVFRKQ
ncbi:MAG: methyltransferase domain-containing protein [Candidatus Aenigmarchaeota archaeon]|nr:methyltransferase domain-containing protein [Candidatus Aenigmarchaeota archaeon]